MTVATLRPNAIAADNANWTNQGGAASKNAALTDNSDATYIQGTVSDGGNDIGADLFYFDDLSTQSSVIRFDLGSIAVPSLAQIRSVTPRVRAAFANQTGSPNPRLTVREYLNGVVTGADTLSLSSTITTFTGAARTTNPSGSVWSQSDIDALQLQFGVVWFSEVGVADAGNWRVYEAYADVYYNEAPVATPSAPTGTITNTLSPVVTWAYSDPENDVQERYRVKVFTNAIATAGGFNPETAATVWDSGEVFGNQINATIGVALTQGASYYAYVKVADAGSNGRYGNWLGIAFTIGASVGGVTPGPTAIPATPTLAISAFDSANNRMPLTTQPQDNQIPWDWSSFEVVGGFWTADTGCNLSLVTAQHLDGAQSLGMTSTVAGSSPEGMGARTPTGTSGVPIVASKTYTALASFKAATTGRSCDVRIDWYTAAGVYISTSRGATISDVTTGWTQASVTAAAPASSAYATIVVEVANQANTEVHYVDCVSLAPGSSTTWFPGGYVGGPNFLLTDDATFENGIGTWTPTSNCTIARTTLQKLLGSSSVLYTATAALTGWFTGGRYAVTPGRRYGFIAFSLAATTLRQVTISASWLDASGTFISSVANSFANSTSAWARVFTYGTAPANAAYVQLILTVNSPANGEQHYFDCVSLHEGMSDVWIAPGVTRQAISIEKSTDGGATWTVISRPVVTVDYYQNSPTVYDYESLGAVSYRARTAVSV